MIVSRVLSWTGLVLSLLVVTSIVALAETTLLNVSYDVSRELYKDVNVSFSAHWKKEKGVDVEVRQSHGGSTKQALAVANGLEADVVTLNQPTDLDFLAEKGAISADWRTKFPSTAAPYTTTSVFLVRKGNPKGIKEWADLAKPGIGVVIPNPKTSGNGRYTYLAAWGSVIDAKGTPADARALVAKIFANVPVFDGGGRGATTTFTQRAVGDVLVTFENETSLIAAEFGDNFDVVYPSVSIEAAPPVAIVDKVAGKHGATELAKGYLDFLFSAEGQEIIARHSFRPRDDVILKKHAGRFPAIRTFRVEDLLGSWADLQKEHFADGGVYDQITTAAN